MLFDGRNDAENGEVGRHVYQHVEHERSHPDGAAADHGQHDIAGLRDGREGHETLQVGLPDGEKVGDRDRKHRHGIEQCLPLADHRAEDLHQHGHQHERRRGLRHDREVGSHGRRRTLVGIGRPEMERHERNLEPQPGEEEDHRHDLQRRPRNARRHIVEIERPRRPVEERDTVEHQTAREQGAEDVFRTRFGRMVLVLVERHQAGHRHRSQFHAQEEEQEIARPDHEIHAQQRRKQQDVEFALFVGRVVAPQPRTGLQADDERPDGQHALDDGVHRHIAEHAAEYLARRPRNDIGQHLHREQPAGHRRKPAPSALPGDQVIEEQQDDHRDERHFGLHVREYIAVIHSRLIH